MTSAAGVHHKAGIIPLVDYAEEGLPVSAYSVDDGLDDTSGSEYSEAPSIHELGTFEVKEIIGVGSNDHGQGMMFNVRWAGFDEREDTWEPASELLGCKALVRAFYEKLIAESPTQLDDPELAMPPIFRESTDEDAHQADFLLSAKHVQPPIDDPQAGWSDDEVEEEGIEWEDAQQPRYLEHSDVWSRYDVPGNGTMTDAVLRLTPAAAFLRTLTTRTSTHVTLDGTLTGLTIILNLISNEQLMSEATEEELGSPVKTLIISIWLIVCLKVHNNRAPTVYEPAWRQCATLKDIAIAIACDSDKFTSNPTFMDLIKYWTGRIEALRSAGGDWSDFAWWRDIPVGPKLFTRRPLCLEEKTYSRILTRRGLVTFAEFVLKKELESGRSPLRNIWHQQREWVLQEALLMFASMSPALLQACIHGEIIALREQTGHPVQEELETINSRGNEAPGTYANSFTDRSGMALSPIHLMPVIQDMNRYIKKKLSKDDNQWAAAIDKTWCPTADWSEAHNLQGYRRYTDWRPKNKKKPRKLEKCKARKAIIRSFVKQLEKRVREATEAGRHLSPCPRAIVNIGFSVRPQNRLLRSHAKHNQSNYIMNLFHALLVHRYRDDFVLQQTIIYTCWKVSQS